MKKKVILFNTFITILLLSACNKASEEIIIPEETVTPIIKLTEVPTPTTELIVEPTITTVPTEEPTVVPTVTNTPTPTMEPTPTEVPHEHVWVLTATEATCTTEGNTVEICECGEQKNLTILPILAHTVEKKVTKEATVEEAGSWEEVCTVCGEVVNSGVIEKLIPTPTPEPTATPTPKATATPTPSPSPTPSPRPDPFEEYTWWNVATQLIRYKDESCTEVEIIDHGYTERQPISLYNYSDLKGTPQEVYVYDYPSTDANVVFTLKMEPIINYKGEADYNRGQAIPFYRCLETGWYYVRCRENAISDEVVYGYVDDEYMKTNVNLALGKNWETLAYPDYCQFEMPYLGPYKLTEHEDIICKVGYNSADHQYSGISGPCISNALFNAYFAPDLIQPDTVFVFSVENPEIVELHYERNTPYGTEHLQYKDGLGYYQVSGAYFTDFTAKTIGTTKVTITQYLISDYNNDIINPVFTWGEPIASTSFTITVTE